MVKIEIKDEVKLIRKMKIGIPRALMYYYFFPFWQEFFQQAGFEVVVSPETDKKIVQEGSEKSVEDICLPFKIYFGHVKYLLDRVDFLFLPRFVSMGKNKKICPKLMGLPDMVNSIYRARLPEILDPVINLEKGFFPLRTIYHQIGSKLDLNYLQIEYAFWQAIKKQRLFNKIQQKGFLSQQALKLLAEPAELDRQLSLREETKARKNFKIAVLGHSYIINDSFLSMDLINNLKKMQVEVITQEMLPDKELKKAAGKQGKELFWFLNKKVLGGAYYFLYQLGEEVAGLIHVSSFGCGPDALTGELVSIKKKINPAISLLNITLDEHSAQTGLMTRLEAFVDLVERKKNYA